MAKLQAPIGDHTNLGALAPSGSDLESDEHFPAADQCRSCGYTSNLKELERGDFVREQLDHPDIKLAPLRPGHARALFEEATPHVLRLTRLPVLSSEAEALDWIRAADARPGQYNFAITHRGRGLIGVVSVLSAGRSGNLFFWVGEPFWGRGYATAAACQMMQFAFEELGLAELFTVVFPHNTRSIRVMEKLGFSELKAHNKELNYYRCGPARLTEAEAWERLRAMVRALHRNGGRGRGSN